MANKTWIYDECHDAYHLTTNPGWCRLQGPPSVFKALADTWASVCHQEIFGKYQKVTRRLLKGVWNFWIEQRFWQETDQKTRCGREMHITIEASKQLSFISYQSHITAGWLRCAGRVRSSGSRGSRLWASIHQYTELAILTVAAVLWLILNACQ